VYHVFEKEIRESADSAAWEDQIGMMEMVLDPAALSEAVRKMREEGGKYTL
jgi:betaine reductase